MEPDGTVILGGAPITVPRDAKSSVTVGIRPEHLTLADRGISAKVDMIEELGADDYLYCTTTLGFPLVARSSSEYRVSKGDDVHFAFDPSRALFFDGEDGSRLG